MKTLTHEGTIRTAIRVSFIILFILISLVGDYVCLLRSRLSVLRGQHVPVTSMTGWVKGKTTVTTIFRLRKLPSGWLGLLMLLAAVLALASDLIVSKLVNSVTLQTRCPFDSGMVLNSSYASRYPSKDSYAYRFAGDGLTASLYNGMETGIPYTGGIYKRIASGADFAATEEDIIGRWLCMVNGPNIEYSLNKTDVQILEDMQEKNLLYQYPYSNNVSTMNDYSKASGIARQTFIMSVSTYENVQNRTIKVAVDLKDDFDRNIKTMQPLYCSLVATQPNDNTVLEINAALGMNNVLANWLGAFRSAFYYSMQDREVIPGANFTIGAMMFNLNVLTMVSGSGDQVFSKDPGAMYGCTKRGTNVPIPVEILCAVILAIAFFLCIYALYLAIAVSRAAKKYDRDNYNGSKMNSRELIRTVPNGLLDWMIQAAQESNQGHQRAPDQGLKEWSMNVDRNAGHRLGMRHQGPSYAAAARAPASASAPVSAPIPMNRAPYTTTMAGPSPGMVSTPGSYFNHKAGYSPVISHEIR